MAVTGFALSLSMVRYAPIRMAILERTMLSIWKSAPTEGLGLDCLLRRTRIASNPTRKRDGGFFDLPARSLLQPDAMVSREECSATHCFISFCYRPSPLSTASQGYCLYPFSSVCYASWAWAFRVFSERIASFPASCCWWAGRRAWIPYYAHITTVFGGARKPHVLQVRSGFCAPFVLLFGSLMTLFRGALMSGSCE